MLPRAPAPVAPSTRATVALAILVAVAGLGLAGAIVVRNAAAGPGPMLSATDDYINVSATGAFSFDPASFSVYPGATVHLKVSQDTSVEHTFTLSPVPNGTIPSSDTTPELDSYFHSHSPLVNLSLGATAGLAYYRNFTAPATVGTYEFVCLYHFASYGMHGTMTVTRSAATGSGPGTPSLSPVELAGVAAAGIVVLAAVAVGLLRRRRSLREARPAPRAKKR